MTITDINTEFKKYPKYKDSGVEWLGKIPKGWGLKRLGSYFIERKTKVSDKDFPPLSVTKNGIVPQLANAAKTNDGDNRKLVKEGDFVINSRSDRKGSSGVAFEDGSVSLINIVMKPKGFNKYYTQYLLKGYSFIEEFYRNGHGIVADLWTTRYDEMKNIKIPIPSGIEQTAIANFLDNKTAKIDSAIAQKEKMIALLKERKQILIQNAVTGKVVYNEKENTWTEPTKVKDSGVEWIGNIPKGWEVCALLGISRFIRGNSSFSKDELLSNGKYVALQYGKTYKVSEIDKKFEYYVNDEFYKDTQVVNNGDTILISTSETIEDLGHSAFYNRNELGLLGGEQMMLKPKKNIVNCKYLYFSSIIFSKELRKYATGIKVFRFNINDLKTIYTAFPPLQEQIQIVTYIETQSAKIDKAIGVQEQQIEKLKEYKSVLIDSAVTGKIKVC